MAVYLMLKILLTLQVGALAVKIGVSKLSTTSTTTLTPNIFLNDSDTTTNAPSQATTPLDIGNSTLAGATTEISKTTPQFPPKISKPTIATTTSALVTTTPTPVVNSTSSNLTNNLPISAITDQVSAFSSNFYCSCDLQPLTCDINCCCDRDCAKEALKAFDCFTPSKYPEFRLNLEDFQYEHGLPSCKVNDGWLCVFRTNTRPPLKKAYHFDYDTKNNYKWPDSLIELTENTNMERNFYKFGDQLKVFNIDTLEIENFEIPYAFKPPFCQISDPIRHLTSTSRSCLVKSALAAQEFKRKFLNYATKMKLLSKPVYHPTDLEDLKDITKDLKLKSCTLSSEAKQFVCQEWDMLYNETETFEFEKYVIEFRIKFFHNFTDLMGCQIELREQELSSSEDPFEVWQKYNVIFIASNETGIERNLEKHTSDQQLKFSGPLGYLQGEPIIVSKYTAYNDSEELSAQNRILNYFKSPNAINNTLRLLSQRASLCNKNYGKDFSINYGISSLTQCTLLIAKDRILLQSSHALKKVNFTEVCVQLQEQILKMLFNVDVNPQLHELNELYISTLGRPKNSSDKWVPLQVQNLDFAPVSGQLSFESLTFICRNILLNAAYDIHIGTFTEHGIAHQALVKNAVLKLGSRHDLEFALNEPLEVPLSLTVMFYDLSLNTGTLIGGGSSGIICLVLIILKSLSICFMT